METFVPVVGLLLGAIGTALLVHLLRELEAAPPFEQSVEPASPRQAQKACQSVLPKAA